MSHSVVTAVQAWLLVRTLRQHFCNRIVSQDVRCFVLPRCLVGTWSTFISDGKVVIKTNFFKKLGNAAVVI